MRFEFDQAKSLANKATHGIDDAIRIISLRRARPGERARYRAG